MRRNNRSNRTKNFYSEFHIDEDLDFAKIAFKNNIVANPIKSAQGLFELIHLYVQNKHPHLDKALIKQFYECFIRLLSSKNTTHPLIPALIEEQEHNLAPSQPKPHNSLA